ncbi:hypothetical protein PanWU01x14_293880 [Parasponia andersonii]|uniref:Uncharacterized protein n=1 Tax=Parasponia andersonii TaxID=3476 RepID=A0A2P5AWD8_PARAD|nr:hypothetical protein PanWU01x14_293880 [Parasponia andersonii]
MGRPIVRLSGTFTIIRLANGLRNPVSNQFNNLHPHSQSLCQSLDFPQVQIFLSHSRCHNPSICLKCLVDFSTTHHPRPNPNLDFSSVLEVSFWVRRLIFDFFLRPQEHLKHSVSQKGFFLNPTLIVG